MAYSYAACAVRVTIFSTGGKFCLVSNFTQLHTLTLVARSYDNTFGQHILGILECDTRRTSGYIKESLFLERDTRHTSGYIKESLFLERDTGRTSGYIRESLFADMKQTLE